MRRGNPENKNWIASALRPRNDEYWILLLAEMADCRVRQMKCGAPMNSLVRRSLLGAPLQHLKDLAEDCRKRVARRRIPYFA